MLFGIYIYHIALLKTSTDEASNMKIEYLLYSESDTKDLIVKNLSMSSKESISNFINPRKAKLINSAQNCYFNVAMQIFFTDIYFVKFFSMRTFDEKTQPISFIMKNMLNEMSSYMMVDLWPYIKELSLQSDKTKAITWDYGYLGSCLTQLLQKLELENEEIAGKNFFYRYKIARSANIPCGKCSEEKKLFLNTFLRFMKSEADEDMGFLDVEPILKENINKSTTCDHCKGLLNKEKCDIVILLPEILIFELGRITFHEGTATFVKFEQVLNVNFEMDDVNFELYGIVLLHDLDKGNFHVSVILNKKNGWYKFDDSIIEPIDIYESDEISKNCYYLLYRRSL